MMVTDRSLYILLCTKPPVRISLLTCCGPYLNETALERAAGKIVIVRDSDTEKDQREAEGRKKVKCVFGLGM